MLCGAEDHIEFLQRKLGKHATFLSDKASLKTLDLTLHISAVHHAFIFRLALACRLSAH